MMRLIIYVEIHLERKLQFQPLSKDFVLLKNSIKNEKIIDLDNFSQKEYLNLITRSFDESDEIIVILNQIDTDATLGSASLLLRKLKAQKEKLKVYGIGCKTPSLFKSINCENMDQVVSVL